MSKVPQGGKPHRAVIHRAKHDAAGRIRAYFETVVSGRWPADRNLRLGGDPPPVP
jgi:hypothetical protein